MLGILLGEINTYLYTYVLIALLIIAGIYFTIRTKFVQVRLLGNAIRVITEKPEQEGGMSSFKALMISTASRVGTGNIAGVSTAIALGGPGATFWMVIMAIFGGSTAFIESTLAQVYKIKDGTGFRGGPAYYIERALKQRWLGKVFAVLLILCFAYGFNALQAFNVASTADYYITDFRDTIWPLVIGIVLALLTAVCIFGGGERISRITSTIVPVMSILYIGLAIVAIVMNVGKLPGVFGEIFRQAFDFQAIAGGFLGSCVMLGIKRGLYSNEAGMGSAPNAAASADVSHPAKQGLVQMISVFIDTLLICTASAMILLLSGIEGSGDNAGMPFVQQAMNSHFGAAGLHFITVSIFLFGFSSLVGNYYYTESNFKYLTENRTALQIFRCTCVAMVLVGPSMTFDMVWDLADVLMGLCAVVNLAALFFLGGKAIKVLDDYVQQKKAGENPVFRAQDVGLTDTDLWK